MLLYGAENWTKKESERIAKYKPWTIKFLLQFQTN
jgi:hypothetical protein